MASIFHRLIKGEKLKTTTKSYTATSGSAFGINQTMAFYRCGSYDNTFPSISRISEAFAEVVPYAIDANGERMRPQPAVISALYSPNKQMSIVDFTETLIVMALVHPKVRVLVWHNENGEAVAGGTITPENIAGFTFLENAHEEYDKRTGLKRYKITKGNGEVVYYTEDEVIEISLNPNPYSILEGYSPSMASKKWATVDDYVADYQAGFFRNGAKPAGEFIITANSREAFDEIVDGLQRTHRGAGANNNIVYTFRPVDQITGKASQATIEWIPFNQNNDQLSLQSLFDQANKKIDMNFGVPAEVKGYLQNSNYASVEVADYIFARRVVYPKLCKVWSKFTHELNRITGGLGCAISFDYELPVLTETRSAQVDELLKLSNAGYELENIVEALNLPKSFLKLGNIVEEEQPQVEEQNEGVDADQTENSVKSVCCHHEEMETISKAVEPDPKLYRAVEDYMREQVASAQEDKEFDQEEGAKRFKKLILPIIFLILADEGNRQYEEGKTELEIAGYDIEKTTEFEINPELKTAYEEYLDKVTLSYTNDTNEAIKLVLEQAQTEQWDSARLVEELGNIMDTNAWRITRLAGTETHRAEQYGHLEAMRQLARETGAEILKIWNVNPLSPNPCETCIALNGAKEPLGEDFGFFKAGSDEIADAHPNCSCFLTFEIVEPKKSVKVVCPNCGRHLFESEGGNAKGIKCQGCKKHFDFDIIKGEVKSVEVEKAK